jgi:hypothetical protein
MLEGASCFSSISCWAVGTYTGSSANITFALRS